MPRPISSRMTSERGPAWFRIAAVSTISTMKVERPRARSSAAPTREKSASTTPICAAFAGTKLPACARIAISAFWRRKVDFPAMFGPVSSQMRLARGAALSPSGECPFDRRRGGGGDSAIRHSAIATPPHPAAPRPPSPSRGEGGSRRAPRPQDRNRWRQSSRRPPAAPAPPPDGGRPRSRRRGSCRPSAAHSLRSRQARPAPTPRRFRRARARSLGSLFSAAIDARCEIVEDRKLDRKRAVGGAGDLLLEFRELRRGEAHGACQRLPMDELFVSPFAPERRRLAGASPRRSSRARCCA